MTYPRRFLPGQTHSISRRVASRRFLLRPSPFANRVVLYALARAKQLNPTVSLHGFVAESNHTHANLTDKRKDTGTRSQVSSFFASLHRLTAAALNTHYDRGENLWASGSFSNTEVHGRRSIEQQLLYLWTNPRIACRGDNHRRIALLVGLSEWRAVYRQAYEALKKNGSAWFPAGTHRLAGLPWVQVRRATGPPLAA